MAKKGKRSAARSRAKSRAAKPAARKSAPKAAAPKRSAPKASAPKRSAPARSAPKSNTPTRSTGRTSTRNTSAQTSATKKNQNSQSSKKNNSSTQSVAERRAAAKKAGVNLKTYKEGLKSGTYNTKGRLTAAGKKQEKGTSSKGTTQDTSSYNNRVTALEKEFVTNNPTAGGANVERHNMMFDDEGYLSYDSEKYQMQANEELKKMGYKAGDMLWKPGTKDNLNGRELTGRISHISAAGNYIPEYVDDAANSSHKGSGFSGWNGEVGLGAEQAAYNKTMSDADQGATDPRTGQVYELTNSTQSQQQAQQYQQNQQDQSYQQPGSSNPNTGNTQSGNTSAGVNWMSNPFTYSQGNQSPSNNQSNPPKDVSATNQYPAFDMSTGRPISDRYAPSKGGNMKHPGPRPGGQMGANRDNAKLQQLRQTEFDGWMKNNPNATAEQQVAYETELRKKQGLSDTNEYGDPWGTFYAGGSPNFDFGKGGSIRDSGSNPFKDTTNKYLSQGFDQRSKVENGRMKNIDFSFNPYTFNQGQ